LEFIFNLTMATNAPSPAPPPNGSTRECQAPPHATINEKSKAKERLTREIRAEVHLRGPSAKKTVDGVSVISALVSEMLKMKQNIEIIPIDDTNVKTRIVQTQDLKKDSAFLRQYFITDSNAVHTSRFGLRPKFTVVFKIRSPISVEEMRKDTIFDTFLRRNNIWLHTHYFKTPRWVAVGLLLQKHHFWCLRQPLEDKIRARVREVLKNQLISEKENIELSDEDIDKSMPVIEISVHNKWTRFMHGQRVVTDVLTIKCDESDEPMLTKLMKSTDLPPREFGVFIPIETSWTNEAAMYKHLLAHMRFLKTIRKVNVVGLFPEILQQIMMNGYPMREHIMQSKSTKERFLFQGIEENQATKVKGSYTFLYFEDDMVEAMNYIDETLVDLHCQAIDHPSIDMTKYPCDLQVPRRTNKTQPCTPDKDIPSIPDFLLIDADSYKPTKPRKRKTMHVIYTSDSTTTSVTTPNSWSTPLSHVTQSSSLTQSENERMAQMEKSVLKQNTTIATLEKALESQKSKTAELETITNQVHSKVTKQSTNIEHLSLKTQNLTQKMLLHQQEFRAGLKEVQTNIHGAINNLDNKFNLIFGKLGLLDADEDDPETSFLDESMDDTLGDVETPANNSTDPHGGVDNSSREP